MQVGPRVILAIHELLGKRREEMQSAAAVYIQTIGRTYLSVRRVAALLELRVQHRLDVRRSALPIQMCFRAFRARRVLRQLRWKKRYQDFVLNRAARAIQKWYLQALGSWERLAEIRRAAAQRETERQAAVTLQKAIRGYLKRRELWLYLRGLVVQNKAAVIIQKAYRSSLVMRYKDMRLNRLAAEVYDMQDMEHEISASKVQALRKKLLESIRVVEESSDSVDDMEDEDNLWQELWDSENNCPYYYNSMLNETTYELPESKNAFQMSLVGKTIKIFWPAMEQWYEGGITRFNKTKKKHRVEYSDGDHEWINLNDEHDRVQILEGDTWVMFNMYEPQVSEGGSEAREGRT